MAESLSPLQSESSPSPSVRVPSVRPHTSAQLRSVDVPAGAVNAPARHRGAGVARGRVKESRPDHPSSHHQLRLSIILPMTNQSYVRPRSRCDAILIIIVVVVGCADDSVVVVSLISSPNAVARPAPRESNPGAFPP